MPVFNRYDRYSIVRPRLVACMGWVNDFRWHSRANPLTQESQACHHLDDCANGRAYANLALKALRWRPDEFQQILRSFLSSRHGVIDRTSSQSKETVSNHVTMLCTRICNGGRWSRAESPIISTYESPLNWRFQGLIRIQYCDPVGKYFIRKPACFGAEQTLLKQINSGSRLQHMLILTFADTLKNRFCRNFWLADRRKADRRSSLSYSTVG